MKKAVEIHKIIGNEVATVCSGLAVDNLSYTQQTTNCIEVLKRAGGELKAFYLTIGRYDAVAIAELPDDTALAKMALALGALGNVRTETLRAFNETEFRKIVGELP